MGQIKQSAVKIGSTAENLIGLDLACLGRPRFPVRSHVNLATEDTAISQSKHRLLRPSVAPDGVASKGSQA